ncbi:MAG: DarT ssDNA thymidine ADP-ribosyltransferase family protein [Candidatus Bipolaricaulia bacterium]
MSTNSYFDYAPLIRKFVEERRIPYLCHFTRQANLSSILTHGLLSVETLSARSIPFIETDRTRLDHAPSAISLSISFPNYRMFSAYRNAQSDPCTWVVLVIHSSVLWEKRCQFADMNAASQRAQDMWARCDPDPVRSFRNLFAENVRDSNGKLYRRKDLAIPPFFPTNPQAEVLVYGSIEPDCVIEVHFESEGCIHRFRDSFGSGSTARRYLASPRFFQPRQDWHHWR